ncbi:hypothetical protein L7E55_15485 [Pelotomaculum isophthalicicum JI]|uniref:Uncharacterized protein n=1 Tax=Pelotomaculum isophthalicicum JI TaxID=947010 RepID=A0A9X4H7M7_9FIRM|nr:hypothetical protein [Pelotomaculum isophthalicicum]MDF9409734.1 hypothetical protein [Pelotomaculum isophthalicicum JI]
MGHHYYNHKSLKYNLILSLLKHFRPSLNSGKKILSPGNILFIGLSTVLLLFFVLTALADIFNGVPVSKWLSMGWNYFLGVPISEIAAGGEKIITEAAKTTTPNDIISVGQLALSSVGLLILALMDEILGIGLLAVAFILRVFNQLAGKPIALFSWILLFFSLTPSIVKHL